MAITAETERPSGPPYPRVAYSWYVVVVLTLAYTVSFIDRQIMALMVGPIRRDLNISDTQMSLLLGLAFAIFYTLLGIPIARLADRYSRRMIITTGITVWCLMTAACGVTRNYTQLFLARVGVGVGEAALSPSALSMISDYFPQETRARAVAFLHHGYRAWVSDWRCSSAVRSSRLVFDAPPVVCTRVWRAVCLADGVPGCRAARSFHGSAHVDGEGTGDRRERIAACWRKCSDTDQITACPRGRAFFRQLVGVCMGLIFWACRWWGSCPMASTPGSRRCLFALGTGPSGTSVPSLRYRYAGNWAGCCDPMASWLVPRHSPEEGLPRCPHASGLVWCIDWDCRGYRSHRWYRPRRYRSLMLIPTSAGTDVHDRLRVFQP